MWDYVNTCDANVRLFPNDTNKTHLESSRNTNGNGWERQFALSSHHCSVLIFEKKILDFIRILEILELLTKVKSPQVVRNHNRHETSLVKIRENDRFPCDFRFLSSTNIRYDAKCKTMMQKKNKKKTLNKHGVFPNMLLSPDPQNGLTAAYTGTQSSVFFSFGEQHQGWARELICGSKSKRRRKADSCFSSKRLAAAGILHP